VSMNDYGLSLVDLKNVGHKDDPWVLADCVTQVFYVLDSEIGKHIVVSAKQKIVGVLKHIEKDIDKNLMPYMRKGGNGKFV
jgi:hypothetical protein